MFRRLSIALLAVTASLPLSSAQMHTGFAPSLPRGTGARHGTRQGARRFAQGIFPGSPFFYSDYDFGEPYLIDNSGDNPDQSDVEGSAEIVPPQIVVVRPASADAQPRNSRPGPLVIEWQGDRYVRYGGLETEDRTNSAHPDYVAPATTKPPLSSAPGERPETPMEERQSAVLVYRDGHREEIADYAIADGVIYVRDADWQNGHWTKHIPLAALDPSATLQANQQRGVKFMLPSAPNVVIASF